VRMLKLLDRQMIRGYLQSYVYCLVGFLTLYVVVDLFTHLDDFLGHGKPFFQALRHIASYYGIKVFQIFDRLCEAIVLMAAVFTVTWMQRNNEQLPYLSAGVSTHRIIAPVLVCACAMLTLAVVNQEVMLPRFADKLMYDKGDPEGDKSLSARSAFEPNGILLVGSEAVRRDYLIRDFRCTLPEQIAGFVVEIQAREARFVPTGPGPRQGYWEMLDTLPADPEPVENYLDVRDVGRCVLYVREVDFNTLTRDTRWYMLAPTVQLLDELQKPEGSEPTAMAVLFQSRIARPFLGVLLVFMGLSVVLMNQNRNLILSTGACLLLCGAFFIVCYACKMLGDKGLISPALSAWLPLLLFGPFALVFFWDMIHT
jgi:lipopolysaccharide export system permease protein